MARTYVTRHSQRLYRYVCMRGVDDSTRTCTYMYMYCLTLLKERCCFMKAFTIYASLFKHLFSKGKCCLSPSVALPACFVSNTRVQMKNATTACVYVYSGETLCIHMSRLWGGGGALLYTCRSNSTYMYVN